MTFGTTFHRGDSVRSTLDAERRGLFVRYCGDGRTCVVDWPTLRTTGNIAVALLRHASVTVVGRVPWARRTTCPQCSAALQFDPDARRGTPQPDGRIRYRKVGVLFCTGCEYAQEVRP